MKNFLILLLIISYSCDTTQYNSDKIEFDKKEYSEAFQLIDYWLEAQKDYEKLPGLTAIVTDKNETKWVRSYGSSNGIERATSRCGKSTGPWCGSNSRARADPARLRP